jgi:hypothetical protein
MANVKISALSTLPGNSVSGNDLFLITQTANSASRSLSISNARIAISDANDYITYNILSSNINSVQSNLDSYAVYANSTFLTTYVVSSYTTSAVNSYPIGTIVSSVNNVSVHLNGVYQNKNQYILSNSSANIQFTDASLASSLSLEIVTIR